MAEETAPGIWVVDQSGSREKYLEFFESGNLADVEVKCGDHTWKLHKFMLCTQSAWFEKALTGPFKEKETGVITLQEQEKCDIDCFLNFIYTGSIDLQKSYPAYEAFVALMGIWKTADFFGHKALCDLAVSAANGHAKKQAQALCTAFPGADIDKDVENIVERSFVPAIGFLYVKELKHLATAFLPIFINLAITSARRLGTSDKFHQLLHDQPQFAKDYTTALMRAIGPRGRAPPAEVGGLCHQCGRPFGKGTVDTMKSVYHTEQVVLCDQCYQMPSWVKLKRGS